jgi:hypothetical protein
MASALASTKRLKRQADSMVPSLHDGTVMKPVHFSVLLATSLLGTACGTEDAADDELAGESGEDGEAGKGDTADAFTYFNVSPDLRACSLNADCGGFFVSRVNRAKTACLEGDASRCYVSALDWSRAALPDATALEAKLFEGAGFLLRGDIVLDTGMRANDKLASDAATLLAPAQPMLNVGAENGPDCLYANLHVTNVTTTGSSITVTPTSAVTARFDGVTITATSQFALACVSGTSQVEIKIAHVDVTGTIANGVLTPAMSNATGITVKAPGMPGATYDMLDLDGKAATLVAQTTALAVGSVANIPARAALSITEAWIPGSDTGVADGVFVMAKDNGIRCITSPCPSIGEMRLNANRSAAIDAVDLAASGADAATVEAAEQDMFGGPGVLIAGDRYYTNGGKGRRANQFWTKAR